MTEIFDGNADVEDLRKWKRDYLYLKLKHYVCLEDLRKFEDFLQVKNGMQETDIDCDKFFLQDDWVWFYWGNGIYFHPDHEDKMLMFKMAFG